MASLFKTMNIARITADDAEALLQLPRTLGADPADGEPIVANNGRYGPYVQKGKDFRSLSDEEQLLTIQLPEALQILAQPKVFRRGGGQNMAAKGPLREFGDDPASGKAVVAKDGRFGVYVTDGETNASLGKGDRLEAMPPERAYELLALRREAILEKGGPAAKKLAGTRRRLRRRRRPPPPRSRRRRSAPRRRSRPAEALGRWLACAG